MYKQAERGFAIPILKGMNRYKVMVQKIHARGLALMSAHVRKIFTLQIFCSTIFSQEFNSTKKTYGEGIGIAYIHT